jgi:hypothetical protein
MILGCDFVERIFSEGLYVDTFEQRLFGRPQKMNDEQFFGFLLDKQLKNKKLSNKNKKFMNNFRKRNPNIAKEIEGILAEAVQGAEKVGQTVAGAVQKGASNAKEVVGKTIAEATKELEKLPFYKTKGGKLAIAGVGTAGLAGLGYYGYKKYKDKKNGEEEGELIISK